MLARPESCGAGFQNVLQRVAVYCSVLQYIAACCSVSQRELEMLACLKMCGAGCCHVLQCDTACKGCCRVLQCYPVCVAVLRSVLHRALQRVAACCSVSSRCWHVPTCVVRGVAICCSVAPCVAACCSVLPCVAACCTVLHSVLQRVHTDGHLICTFMLYMHTHVAILHSCSIHIHMYTYIYRYTYLLI